MTKKINKIYDLEQENANYIEISSGVLVHSTTESLACVEETINRLMKKHKNFISIKKNFKLGTGIG